MPKKTILIKSFEWIQFISIGIIITVIPYNTKFV